MKCILERLAGCSLELSTTRVRYRNKSDLSDFIEGDTENTRHFLLVHEVQCRLLCLE